MRKNLDEFLETMKKKYNNQIKIEKLNAINETQIEIPEALMELYSNIKHIQFPFGEIYTKEVAIKQSSQRPFFNKWFVFGWDGYFTYWLCSYKKSEEGFSFTYWDHEYGNDIEEPVWENLCEFLEDIEEEYQDSL